jgi:hypothetical protein
MPRKDALINADPFCEVRLDNVQYGDRATDKFMVAVQEPETEGFVPIPGVGTVHSGDYKLVTNRQVHDMAAQVMEDTGMTFKPIPTFGGGHSSPIFWNGRRFSEKWFCEEAAVDVPGGSQMRMGIEVTNSYDGSCKVGLAFFAMHCVCSNQFYGANLMGRPFEFPHVNHGGMLEEDINAAMQQIQSKASDFAKIGPNMQLLGDTRVTSLDDFIELRQRIKTETRAELRDKQLLDELAGQGVSRELDLGFAYTDPSSFWNIANAYTAVTTHMVGGPRGADQSGRVTDWLLTEAATRAVA